MILHFIVILLNNLFFRGIIILVKSLKININDKDIKIILANTFFKKLKGLMFLKEINFGMLFPQTNSIHTFFMKDNIDVIGLNEDNIVILKKENMAKRKILIIKNKAKKTSILELPKNTSSHIKIGDKLTFISE